MHPKPHAFIFDIDGTLVDSNEFHVDAWDRTFRYFGKQFPREALRAQIGKGSDQYLPEFLTPEEIKVALAALAAGARCCERAIDARHREKNRRPTKEEQSNDRSQPRDKSEIFLYPRRHQAPQPFCPAGSR